MLHAVDIDYANVRHFDESELYPEYIGDETFYHRYDYNVRESCISVSVVLRVLRYHLTIFVSNFVEKGTTLYLQKAICPSQVQTSPLLPTRQVRESVPRRMSREIWVHRAT